MTPMKSTVFFIALILIQENGIYVYCQQNKGVLDSVIETVTNPENVVFGLKVAGTAAVGIVAAPAVIGAAGFGAAGVGAGTVAAAVQSTWFGSAITGVTGAAFSALQSAGAAGLSLGAKSVIVATSGAVVKVYDSVVGNSKEKGNDCSKR
ncbi:hypothetical protein JTE90_000528 [Oedothorax gibbosus]|uniref:Uncharacterized protein n=1 Tax=Oedothorax gibbosus TaxID=931172 RepID=A0AAV6VXG0_9ARAC|nr:hypothetical protein JTE90_000528 [Oedothorax gibbosus]